ncbi:hypothetical protein [Kocuria atrinae]|uniref:hypothetical protein n=1 Tax=Kocuria atrinae TaxID=592377 RepID=UPI001CB895F2|nr:hypothetical protein [Kocuria atrinae]
MSTTPNEPRNPDYATSQVLVNLAPASPTPQASPAPVRTRRPHPSTATASRAASTAPRSTTRTSTPEWWSAPGCSTSCSS